MRLQTLQRAATAATAMLIVAAVLVVTALTMTPLDSPRAEPVAASRPAAAAPAALAPLEQYLAVCQRDLRMPLFPTATPKPTPGPIRTPAPAPEAAVPFRLLGTIMDGDAAYGLIRLPGGAEKLVAAGESVCGVTIRAISSCRLTCDVGGQVATVVARPAAAHTPAPSANAASGEQPLPSPSPWPLSPQPVERPDASPAPSPAADPNAAEASPAPDNSDPVERMRGMLDKKRQKLNAPQP